MTKRVGCMLNEETWETFRNLVKAKYGKVRGAFGSELEKAMLAWVSVSSRTPSHTNSMVQNPKHGRSVNTANKIYSEICRVVPQGHVQVSRQILEDAIVVGGKLRPDNRNYITYIPLLCKLGFLAETRYPGIYAITERVEAAARDTKGGRVPEAKLLGNAREKLQGAR